MTAKLTNIIRTHKGIEYRDVGSSTHQAFWDGYDNMMYRRRYSCNHPQRRILLPVWKKGRAAAKKGLYQDVQHFVPRVYIE